MIAGAAWLTVLASASLLYVPVLVKLAHDWNANPAYSHGFLVLPIALFLVWRRRDTLARLPLRPAAAGLALVLAGIGLFVGGTLGAELFITRVSMIAVAGGTVLFAFGWRHLRVVAFPLAFLLFMIPLPAIVLDRAAVSLQLLASRLGEQLLRTAGVPVLRDGNVLTLANVTLEVTDACSGIRSLIALLAMTTLIGHLFERSRWRRAMVVAAAVPLAIALNGVRIATTGIAASHFGPDMARGTVHEVTGWVVFVAALVAVWVLHTALHTYEPRPFARHLEAV